MQYEPELSVVGFGKKFKCDTCGARFDSPEMLLEHMRTHARRTVIRCDACGADFATRDELAEHVRSSHPM